MQHKAEQLFVSQWVTELRVKAHPCAVGTGSGYLVRYLTLDACHHSGDEGLTKAELAVSYIDSFS
jgi:hypothetical protein